MVMAVTLLFLCFITFLLAFVCVASAASSRDGFPGIYFSGGCVRVKSRGNSEKGKKVAQTFNLVFFLWRLSGNAVCVWENSCGEERKKIIGVTYQVFLTPLKGFFAVLALWLAFSSILGGKKFHFLLLPPVFAPISKPIGCDFAFSFSP